MLWFNTQHWGSSFLFFLFISTSSSGNSTTGWGEGVRGEGGAIRTGRGSVTSGLSMAPWCIPDLLSSFIRKSNSRNALCNYIFHTRATYWLLFVKCLKIHITGKDFFLITVKTFILFLWKSCNYSCSKLHIFKIIFLKWRKNLLSDWKTSIKKIIIWKTFLFW